MEIVNSARLTLGYIFFELSSYRAAVRYLLDVSPDFSDYPEALLAIGWAAFKLKDYQTATVALTNLVEDFPNFYNLEEAHFVLGQCYLNLGEYDSAINEYQQIIQSSPRSDDFDSIIEIAKTELAKQEKLVEGLKTELLVLESRLLDAIPLKSGNGVPDYVTDERMRIRGSREEILDRIYRERQEFESVSTTIFEVRRRIEKAERQKDWRSYAEFGKGRALYLKGIRGQ